MTTKLGRPKLAKGKAKGILIGARFSTDEAKEIHAAIKRAGLVKSEWIRFALLSRARAASV